MDDVQSNEAGVRRKHKTYMRYENVNHPAYVKVRKEAKKEIKKAKVQTGTEYK